MFRFKRIAQSLGFEQADAANHAIFRTRNVNQANHSILQGNHVLHKGRIPSSFEPALQEWIGHRCNHSPLTTHSFKSMRRQPEGFQVDEIFLDPLGASIDPRLVVARFQNVAQVVEDFIVRGQRTLAEQSGAGRWSLEPLQAGGLGPRRHVDSEHPLA